MKTQDSISTASMTPLPLKKRRKAHSHGVSLVSAASASNKSVQLYLGLADALFASATISQGGTIGGLGPSYINELCDIALRDKSAMNAIGDAIASRFIDYIIENSKDDTVFAEKIKVAEATSPSKIKINKKKPSTRSTIPKLARQAIRFSLKQKSLLQGQCQLKNPISKKVINKLNRLVRDDHSTSIDLTNPQDPFELCEELLRILIPQISQRKHSNTGIGLLKPSEFLALLPQLAEFIVRTFFSATYLFCEASTSFLYLKKYAVTYISDTAKTLVDIVTEGANYKLDIDVMLEKANQLTAPSAPPLPQVAQHSPLEINKNNKDLLKTCDVEKSSVIEGLKQSSSPLHFLKQTKPLSFILAHQLISICKQPDPDNKTSNLAHLKQKSERNQRQIADKLKLLSTIIFPHHSEKIYNNNNVFTWPELETFIQQSPPAPHTTLEVKCPDITDPHFSQASTNLAAWIIKYVFLQIPKFTFGKADLTPLIKNFTGTEPKASKKNAIPGVRSINAARELILSAISERLSLLHTDTGTAKNLTKKLEIVQSLISFPITSRQFKSNIKHTYNVTALVNLFKNIAIQLLPPLKRHMEKSISSIKRQNKVVMQRGENNIKLLEDYSNSSTSPEWCMSRVFSCLSPTAQPPSIDPRELQQCLFQFVDTATESKNIIQHLVSLIKQYEDIYEEKTIEGWRTDISVIQIQCFFILFYSEVSTYIFNKIHEQSESVPQENRMNPAEVFDHCRLLLREHINTQQSQTHQTKTAILAKLNKLPQKIHSFADITEELSQISPKALHVLKSVRETPFLVIQQSVTNITLSDLHILTTNSPSPQNDRSSPQQHSSQFASEEKCFPRNSFANKQSEAQLLKIGF